MQPWVHWFEIPASDLARAQRFYEAVFGIQLSRLEPAPGLAMALFPDARDGMAGSGALLYLDGGPDLDLPLSRVESNGGKLLIPKRQISPERGFMGVFQDTEGNRIALHSMA